MTGRHYYAQIRDRIAAGRYERAAHKAAAMLERIETLEAGWGNDRAVRALEQLRTITVTLADQVEDEIRYGRPAATGRTITYRVTI